MLMHPDIGVLNGGKCYVFLEGYGLNREPMSGTYEECLNAIEARGGVDDPIPTDGSHTMADYRAALVAATKAEPLAIAALPPKDPASKEADAKGASPKGTATKKRAMREYLLTFRTIEEEWRGVDGYRDGQEKVFAYDRNEAMRKGRDIIRDTVGRFGPKTAINARLAR